jgi:PII-like signaling protein
MIKTSRLRVYSDDSDTCKGKPVYQWLIEEAHSCGMRGATAFRGIMGYGGHDEIHSSKVFVLAADLPIVVEIIDSPEKIQQFIRNTRLADVSGLATVETLDSLILPADQK